MPIKSKSSLFALLPVRDMKQQTGYKKIDPRIVNRK